jgi:hypothetical protein
MGTTRISDSIDMRSLFLEGPERFEAILSAYCDELEQVFPSDEIESRDQYRRYLSDEGTWNMIVLVSSNDTICGGIQFQVINGAMQPGVVWAEHLWLTKAARTFRNFAAALKTAQTVFRRNATLVMFEFNDQNKMTSAEIKEDELLGTKTSARERLWGRIGARVLVDDYGVSAPYAQPGMDGQDPVEFLTLGFFPLANGVCDSPIQIDDYAALVMTAHCTIPGVGENDPTVRALMSQLQGIQMSQPTTLLHFVPLNQRIASARRVA